MKRMQRIISGWLAFCLVLSMLPMQVFAEERISETMTTEAVVVETTTETEETAAPAEETSAPEVTDTLTKETTVLTEETTATEPEATQSVAEEPTVQTEEWIPDAEETDPADKIQEVSTIQQENVVLQVSQAAMMSNGEYVSEEEAVLQLRENLKQRNPEFTIYVQTTDFEAEAFWNLLYEQAVAHTGNPTEGDYILHHMYTVSVKIGMQTIDGVTYVKLEVTATYLSTAAQEAELDSVYASVMNKLSLSGKSDYLKVCAIYNYIADNIFYDHENKHDDNNLIKHSAYAALVNKSCVCQGYANLFYRMALDAGLDCRIIAGLGNGERHSWNIVCVDGIYYNLDSTWDSEISQNGYEYAYFLTSDASFYFHSRDNEYLTNNFTSQYPISNADYSNIKLVDQQDGDFKYSVYAGRVTVTKYTGTEKDVVVPAELRGYPVYYIGKQTFYENETVETITFSEGIVSVYSEHIYSCDALKFVHYPSTLQFGYTTYPVKGFISGVSALPSNCLALEHVSIAETNHDVVVVDNILYSKDMKTLIFCPTNDPREIIKIPESVEVIDHSAFEYNKNLKEVIMPDTVRFIGYWAFSDCEKLKEINISGNCEVICQFAFRRTAVKSYHFPATLSVFMQSGLFSNIEETITVDENNPWLYAVDNVLFANSPEGTLLLRYPAGSAREEYSIPEGVTEIADFAFEGAVKLKRLFLPNSIERFEFPRMVDQVIYYPIGNAFGESKANPDDRNVTLRSYCVNQHTYDSDKDPTCNICEFTRYNEFYDSVVYGICGQNADWILTADDTMIITGSGIMYDNVDIAWEQYKDQITSVVIDGINNVGWGAFQGCKNLKRVTLPDGIVGIDAHAFRACHSLSDINLPEGIVSIAQDAFSYCYSLNNLILPEGLESIGSRTFLECSNLSSVILPDSINYIGEDAFSKCVNLKDITFKGSAPQMKRNALGSGPATIWYPETNTSWIDTVRQDFGNDFQWMPYCGKEHNTVVIPAVEPYCGNDGWTAGKKCSICGFHIMAPRKIPANGTHIYSSDQDVVCDECGYIRTKDLFPDHEHEYRSTETSPICSGEGYTKYTCTCGAYYYDYTIYPEHDEKILTGISTTCTTSGLTEGKKCSVCGTITVEQITILAQGHIWDDGIQTSEPTEHTTGVMIYTCTFCGETMTKEIPVLGHVHDYAATVVAPTCTEQGYTAYTCACGDSYRDAYVDALGHSEIAVGSKAPTCIESGLTAGTECDRCGTTLVALEVIPATGHGWDDGVQTTAPTETAAGIMTYTCTICGETRTEEISPLDHAHDYTTKVVAPTCTAGGYTTYTCACGDSYQADKVAALGHKYNDNVDGTCNSCSVNRETVETRKVTHMFRMYNPNTGEHFYTGSEEEKGNLVAVGWQYEGVGFTFPANTGAPVHRLFQPSTGEHLYTMDEEEKAKLMADGWNYEGIAFNSAYDTEAVQHRLHNPNATVGAYHFTFSEEEKQNLIAAGWEYQGIGWYSCWK